MKKPIRAFTKGMAVRHRVTNDVGTIVDIAKSRQGAHYYVRWQGYTGTAVHGLEDLKR